MTRALQKLLAGGMPEEPAIAAFLEENTFPIVEGRRVSFVYHGEADEVHLRHFIYGLPASQPLTRVDGTDLWHAPLELPERSRVEYKLEVVRGDQREWIRDPLNPLIAHDPFGANSVCQGEGYEIPEWTRPDPEAREGTLDDLPLPRDVTRGGRVRIYLPARFRRTRRYPLLIVHDGTDFLRYSDLRTVLDNLIHRLEIPPLIVALTDSADRLREYAADPLHAEFLTKRLLPRLEDSFPVISRPAARGLMGASFGGVASLFTAWRYPGVYGRVLSLSGSFGFTDIGEHRRGPVFDPVVEWVNRFREEPGRPTERLYLACGTYESLIYENRSLVPLLQETGIELRYVEARDGHNWENWRDRLREGLSWLFPGPLWMVYE